MSLNKSNSASSSYDFSELESYLSKWNISGGKNILKVQISVQIVNPESNQVEKELNGYINSKESKIRHALKKTCRSLHRVGESMEEERAMEEEEEKEEVEEFSVISQEKIFGNKLSKVLQYERTRYPELKLKVPKVVLACKDHIFKHGLTKEGIFRISGSTVDINSMVDAIDRGEDIEFSFRDSVHNASGLLKLYLRKLPQPLLTDRLYSDFLGAVDMKEEDAIIYLKKSYSSTTP